MSAIHLFVSKTGNQKASLSFEGNRTPSFLIKSAKQPKKQSVVLYYSYEDTASKVKELIASRLGINLDHIGLFFKKTSGESWNGYEEIKDESTLGSLSSKVAEVQLNVIYKCPDGCNHYNLGTKRCDYLVHLKELKYLILCDGE